MLGAVDQRWQTIPREGISVQENMVGDEISSGITPSETMSIDELKSVKAYTHVRTQVKDDPKYFFYPPGDASYFLYPFAWVDLPRNHLENKGSYSTFKNNYGKTGIDWTGVALVFKDPIRYLNSLSLIQTPADYIRYLKLAPLAGFNITGNAPVAVPRGYYANVAGLIGGYDPTLPAVCTTDWWMEVITWYVLQNSFTMLRMAQIEDKYDLEAAYMNSGKLIDSLKADMRSPEFVDTIPTGFSGQSKSVRLELALVEWQLVALEEGIQKVRMLIDENRKKMAARAIELSTVDATIAPTSFSVDPYQNPYLVLDPQRSAEAKQPIFTNVARNLTANWKPPEVAAPASQLQYWNQVPAYTAQHERTMATEYGPASEADIAKYGLDNKNRINWLPWLAAGAAAAYAVTQFK